MTALTLDRHGHEARLALLPRYEGRAPRYTSYPTAVQFTPAVDADVYAGWLRALPPEKPVSLYVHVPFCARLCWYCGCNTRVVRRGESISDYVGLLVEELAMVEAALPGRLKVDAIHLGGGTPNMLGVDDLATLFGAIRQVFRVSPGAEIAAEIDPAQIRPEWARAAAFHGLNRVSLGVQDLSPDVQAAVNRPEPFAVVALAAATMREAGVEALNFDLMYGLPRQRTADVLNTLDQVLTLRPARVALFGYAHVPWMKSHQKLIHDDELPAAPERLEQSEAAAERLRAEGYVAIGLDHFALSDDPLAGPQVRRNFQGYTADAAETLIGLGVSAIGRLPGGFVQNQPQELAWRKAITAGRLATARGVAFTPDDLFRGEIIERLMCDFTVDLVEVCARHDESLERLAPDMEKLAGALADGVVTVDHGRVTVTPMGRPFVRSVCMAFDAYVEPEKVRHSMAV